MRKFNYNSKRIDIIEHKTITLNDCWLAQGSTIGYLPVILFVIVIKNHIINEL